MVPSETGLGTEPVTYHVYRISVVVHGGSFHLRGTDGWDIEYAVTYSRDGRERLRQVQRDGDPVTPELIQSCIETIHRWRQWRRDPPWQDAGTLPALPWSTGDRTPEERPVLPQPEPLPDVWVPRAGRLLTFEDEDV